MESNDQSKSITLTVRSVSEYVSIILSEKVECDFTERSSYYFRGQADIKWSLTPSISRIKNYEADFDLERELIERSKNELPDLFADPALSPVELLTLLQHSGIPTRLLDLTENPLVALYFAIVDSNGDLYDSVDGEVIQFKDSWSSECITPWENAIADSYHFLNGNVLLEDAVKSALDKSYFDGYRKDPETQETDWALSRMVYFCTHPMFISSKAHLDRQSSQRGHYLLFPNSLDSTQKYITTEIKPMSKDDSRIVRRFIIPSGSKAKMLADLDRLGINESTLYPDSVDHICKYITRKTKQTHDLPNARVYKHYSPGGPQIMLVTSPKR